MGKRRLDSDYGLDNCLVDISLYFGGIMALLFQVSVHEIKTPFMSNVVCFLVFIENEFAAVFIYCVISQMHEKVVQVALMRRDVDLSGEPREPLLVNVDT